MFSLSVIVPNYNNGKYLSECLNSIVCQTYPIKEIVVYDDCSTDDSKKILEDFMIKDQRIKVIYGKKNVGVSTARDIAIKNITSDYVCMLDADDFFFSDKKIEVEMKKIQEIYKLTGRKVISFSQTVDVNEQGEPLKCVKYINLSGHERFKIVTRLYKSYMPRDYCFPKEIYNACGGYTKDLSLYEDWELNIKFLNYTEFIYSGGLGTAYRHKDGGLSSVDYKKQLKVKKSIINKYPMNFIEKGIFYIIAYSAFLKHRFKGEWKK